MATALSPRTAQLIETLFSPEDAAEASHWLEGECGNNLPRCDKLDEHGDEARMDWRDLLMAVDFGYDVHAHDAWAKDILNKR